jgi:predicted transcriptional regulator
MRLLMVRLRAFDIALLVLAGAILLGGVLSSSVIPAQQSTQVTVTKPSVVVVTSVRTSIVSTATTVTQVSVQTSTLTTVSTETVRILITGTAALGMTTLAETIAIAHTSYTTVLSSITHTQVLSSQLPVYVTAVAELTQYVTTSEILTAVNSWFVTIVVLPILISLVVFGGASIRVHGYRTRLHIYHEILQYVAESPRIPSHIMRRCNLETRKFTKYMSTLDERGFIQRIREDGDRYTATDKARDYLRDPKLSAFMKELP